MPDRESVVKAIDICLGHGKCNDCPYSLRGKGYTTMNCRGYMLRDVLALLKAQDATWEYNPDDNVPYCSNCMMPQDMPTKYCHSCGAKMDYDGL